MNHERYEQHLARFREIFAEHRLTQVVVTDDLRAYWLRKPGTSFYSAFVVVGPTGITISGDCRFGAEHALHCPHKGWAWWTSPTLHESYDYLAQKFCLQKVWDEEQAENEIREWLACDDYHTHRERRPTWDDDFEDVNFHERSDVWNACVRAGMEWEDVPEEVWSASAVAMLGALQEAFVRELAKEEVAHAGA